MLFPPCPSQFPSPTPADTAQYLNRKSLRQKPTAHISYHQGLRLVRQFIAHASHHTVEEIQAFTSQWVPAPTWIKVKEVQISDYLLKEAAKHLQEQLGPKGIEAVGGKQWWQWRQDDAPLVAEWIEMRRDYNSRKKQKSGAADRIILYVHGGAYYFGSVDEHRYQMQRHARKLKARCLAPRYRLSPQFPFPCGLQDCLAAYLYLIGDHDSSHILLAGDSAGGGMTMAMLVTIRDQGLPMPAGALLLSPWVDLTHSFPSLDGDASFDYIPAHGFHHKPSRSWPAPTEEMVDDETRAAVEDDPIVDFHPDLSIVIDGKPITIKDQIQMYAPNHLLTHPLVSPILTPSLGGLPPLLIQAGGGELLKDEQIYLAHKAANPPEYLPSDAMLAVTDPDGTRRSQHPPTPVQLQVWDDLCHVAHTLSWTRPAKYMYRAVAQFGSWALARAQHRSIDTELSDDMSEISIGDTSPSSASSPSSPASSTTSVSARKKRGLRSRRRPASRSPTRHGRHQSIDADTAQPPTNAAAPTPPTLLVSSSPHASAAVGKAGDPLPPFENNMIRQRVDRHGVCRPLAPPAELAALNQPRDAIGAIKEGPVRKWLAARQKWARTYAGEARRVRRLRAEESARGYMACGAGERPPPMALVGRRRMDGDGVEIRVGRRLGRSWGMSLWALWGSKHDEKTIERERRADLEERVRGGVGVG